MYIALPDILQARFSSVEHETPQGVLAEEVVSYSEANYFMHKENNSLLSDNKRLTANIESLTQQWNRMIAELTNNNLRLKARFAAQDTKIAALANDNLLLKANGAAQDIKIKTLEDFNDTLRANIALLIANQVSVFSTKILKRHVCS